jgi:hypothetical protein
MRFCLYRVLHRHTLNQRKQEGRACSAGLGVRAVLLAALPLMAWALAGCGSSTGHSKLRRAHPYQPLGVDGAFEHVDGHLREADQYGLTLAKIETTGGGRITIVAKRRGAKKPRIFLEYNMQEPAEYGPGGVHHSGLVPDGGGGGIELNNSSEGILSMSGEGECLAGHRIVFAYGELSSPRDTLMALGGGRPRRVAEVPIPSRLHPHGVLVYAVLPGGPMYVVVVRAPDGRVVYREPLGNLSKDAPCRAPNR